jgi:small subunit ribosomal protein S1
MTYHNNSEQSSSQKRQDKAYWSALFEQVDTNHAATLVETAVPPEEDLPTHTHTSAASTNGYHTHLPANPWPIAQKAYEQDEILNLKVTGCNKGGLLIYWNGIQGFVPASQLENFPPLYSDSERLQTLQAWVGKELKLRIIEINPDLNRLILSERAAQVDATERDQLFETLSPGDIIEGTVTNLTDFGAFVDLGGIEGLIHISELSWSRVTHPSRIVKPNQKVKALILSIDPENKRIALSMKQLRKNPWKDVEQRYKPGQLVRGVVSNVVNFGAFVQLEDELEGLIHISELAEGSFLHPRNVVTKGEMITARVLHVNGSEKKLALSLRQLNNTNNGHSH